MPDNDTIGMDPELLRKRKIRAEQFRSLLLHMQTYRTEAKGGEVAYDLVAQIISGESK